MNHRGVRHGRSTPGEDRREIGHRCKNENSAAASTTSVANVPSVTAVAPPSTGITVPLTVRCHIAGKERSDRGNVVRKSHTPRWLTGPEA